MNADTIQKVLSRFGVTEQIGQAVFGRVYRGRIGDRQVAIKIESRGSASREAENLAYLKSLRDVAPPEVRRHLPEVYDIQAQDDVHFYVMELLAKPDPKTVELIYGSSIDNVGETDLWDHIIDGVPAGPAIDSAILDFSDDRWQDQQMLDSAWSVWVARASEAPGRATDPNLDTAIDDLKSSVMQTIGLYWRAAKQVTMSEVIAAVRAGSKTDLARQMAPETTQFFSAAATATHIPLYDPNLMGPRTYWGVSRHLPSELPVAVQSLLSALKWLRANGLSWGDAHSGNIMMRPSTGDLVFIDFGLYLKLTTSNPPPDGRPDSERTPTVSGRRPAGGAPKVDA